MRRGEIWTVAGGKDYAGKPRPAVILQDDVSLRQIGHHLRIYDRPTDAPLFRLQVERPKAMGCALVVA